MAKIVTKLFRFWGLCKHTSLVLIGLKLERMPDPVDLTRQCYFCVIIIIFFSSFLAACIFPIYLEFLPGLTMQQLCK